MNILKLFKQPASAEWIETMLIKETKKTGERPTLPSAINEEIVVNQTVSATEHARQTVCTSENFTHNDEENQQIRKVHDELAGIIFTPALAF